MKNYKVWAVQLLHDQKDIEAESDTHAAQICTAMYHGGEGSDAILDKYGDLDPSDIADGACGVVGIEEFDLWTAETGEGKRQGLLAKFAIDTLRTMSNTPDWSADTLDEIQQSAFEFGLASDCDGFFHFDEEPCQ